MTSILFIISPLRAQVVFMEVMGGDGLRWEWGNEA